MKPGTILRIISLLVILFLAACEQQAALTSTVTATASSTSTLTSTSTLPPPTETITPVPSPTLFPLPPIDAAVVSCSDRRPAADDLLPIVTEAFGLSRYYVPPDLVSLGHYLPGRVTLPELQLRKDAAEALKKLVEAMQSAGLAPTVLSAYRSYNEQVVVRQDWETRDPANAALVSALPGHSEHQLGTVVDFGSPELPGLTGDTVDKFSPLFVQTGEGSWLAEHAHEYGFTMTNPPEAQPWTGLIYEPWHFRYVGIELANYLHDSGYFLTEYLFQVRPGLPCVP
jgi:D-alanyl-D-alanine carboxypeptidase